MISKKIIICLNPFISHLLPTLSFARYMIERGHSVVYMGFSNMEEPVIKEGFQFIALSSCSNEDLVDLQNRKAFKELSILYKKLHVEIKNKILKYNPDIVLMGISRFQIYLIPAMEYQAKIYLYSLCAGSPRMTCKSPPITSDYISASAPYPKIIALRLWAKRLFRKGINLKVFYERMFYPWPYIYKICRRQKVHWHFGIDGFFPSFPLLSFGSRLFELNAPIDIKYLGLGVSKRKEIETNTYIDNNKPLIYCCLGTMNCRYKKAEAFYSAIIELFKMKPEWNLILSLGNNHTVLFNYQAENIAVYDYVQQLAVIEKASVVITHGGHSTVKECIHFGVPMLVFPCSYDQKGNAARIQLHEIGLMSSLLKTTKSEKKNGIKTQNITVQNLKNLISQVLDNPKYKNNIQKMSTKIKKEDELNLIGKLFE